ncbi:hypothetical protein [Streptomyces sp. NPDC001781]
MSKEARCAARCTADPVITKPVPLCALHGLEVAQEVLPGVLRGSLGQARRDAAAHRLTARLEAVATAPDGASMGPPERLPQAEAQALVEARLEALRAAGVEWVTIRHFRDIPPMAGRSRSWVYMVLGSLVDRGALARDDRGDQTGYRFAA